MHWLKNCGRQVAIAQCDGKRKPLQIRLFGGAACPAGSPYAGVAERQRIASSIVAVPKLGTTPTTEYSFTKAICQSTGGWLFAASRIWKFYFRLRLALRLGGMGLGLSSHIVGAFELLGQAQYPQERREILRGNLLKGYLANLSQNSWISISVSLPCPMACSNFSFTSSSVGCGSAVVLSLRCASRMSRTMLSRSSCITWL